MITRRLLLRPRAWSKLRFMPIRLIYMRQSLLLLMALSLLVLSGCAQQVSTADIRRDISTGNFASLGAALNDSLEETQAMTNALNLGRFHQFQANWDESIKYFDIARAMLEEYEQRAIISLRNVGGGVGSYTFSRGSAVSFGTGYERSLMHTFNGINYLMKKDFQGAAVEMKRMEYRQELWLEEVEHRLRARVDEIKENQAERAAQGDSSEQYMPSSLPAGYSMGEILSSPELRGLASSYQDAFSYSLSAITCRIYGDTEYAKVSLARACQLDERAYEMFRSVWQRPAADAKNDKRWEPALPPLPRQYREGAANNPASQELVLIFFGGLGPAMKMEQIRMMYPHVGYIMIDLPSYEPELPALMPQLSLSAGSITPQPLLRPDLLAYRHLQDEIGWELASSISRAITRVAVSAAGQAVAASNEDTEGFAPLIGLLLTIGMDFFATKDGENVRNWELLPARGYLGMSEVPRGTSITLTFSGNNYTVEIPKEARGMIMLVSQVENTKLKVDYVTY